MSESPPDSQLFDRYLDLLGIKPKRPTYAALEELVTAHMLRIPFENVSKLYYLKRDSLRDIPDIEKYLTGIADYHFGGTCYSNNYYLNRLLRHLGFDAMLCGADMQNPDVHLVNIVALDGRGYLVDTGYAAPFLKPMPRDLAVDYETRLGRDRYVLRPRDPEGRSRMDLFRDGELIHGYTAKPIPRRIDDFSSAIRSSFRPDSTFMTSLLLVRFFEGRSLAVYNLSVIESSGSDYTVRRLSDRNELPGVIEEHFGIPAEIAAEAVAMLGELGNAWS